MTTANTIITRCLVVDFETPAGTVRALSLDALDVDGGSSVAIMGVSGCGKSTLLGLLAGLDVPTSGAVTIGDTVVSTLSERARVRFRRNAIGMVYQADNLLPHLTVEENIGLPLAIRRAGQTDHGDEAREVGRLVERLGLGELRERLPDQLSGGQRQRAAVARAIVHRPAVILADEPTGALDATNGQAVIELLVEVQQEIGATLVVVTHDPAVAAHTERTVRLERSTAAAELLGAR